MAPTNNNKENDPKNSSKKEGKVKRVKTQAQRDRQNKSIFKKRHAEQALVGASDAFIKAKQFMLKKNAADATATAAPFAATATATATAAAAATATNPSPPRKKAQRRSLLRLAPHRPRLSLALPPRKPRPYPRRPRPR